MNDELLASQQYRDLSDICHTDVQRALLTIPNRTETTTAQAADGPINHDEWDDKATETIAATIASHGHVVTAVRNDPNHKTPDALVDGQPVEFKTITGSGKSTIKKRLRKSEEIPGQAEELVIKIDDTSSLGRNDAERQIQNYFSGGDARGTIKRVTVYCNDGSTVTYPPGYRGL
jgi:hypothetical protein